MQNRLVTLIPPENMRQAKALAVAGELVIPHLVDGAKYRRHATAACVRTLALVGGDHAQSALEHYANDARQGVRKELLGAWGLFEGAHFVRQVISVVVGHSQTFCLDRASTLEGIECLPDLTSLEVCGRRLRDFTPIAALGNLTSLNLRSCDQLSDLSPLAELRNLTWLHLCYCEQVRDLSPLAGLGELISLDLSCCSRVSDLSPLALLGELTSLDLGWCKQVSDLRPLGGLGNLTSLDLSYCVEVSDLSPLAGLGKLTSLNLSDCEQVRDLSPLAGLKNLTKLRLVGCWKHLELRALKELKELWIGGP